MKALSIPQRLYLVPRLSLWLLPYLLVLSPQSSLADTILFSDLAEEFTVSVTDPVREQVHGSGSGDFVLISPPDGATLIAGGGVAYWWILEPGTVFRGPF